MLHAEVSPLTYTALIGLFPYTRDGFSTRLKNRVIFCNIFYFSMSMSCRIVRIIISKRRWSINIFQFFRVFVYLSIQIVQMIFFGFHLKAMFSNRKVMEIIAKESTRVPSFFKAVTYIDVAYTGSMCVMFVFRCIALNTYFGIWNTITITFQNHFSLQITMLFTFFVYNITKRHELLTQRLVSAETPHHVLRLLEHHYKLMKRIESLNGVFARPLVFMYGDIFISLSYYSYYITTLESESEGQILSYVLNMLLLAGRFTMLFSTSFIAERLVASADKFNMTLYTKMKSDDELCMTVGIRTKRHLGIEWFQYCIVIIISKIQKLLRLYIILPKTTRLSACGFFELGNELVTSMAAAVVTYLVALVQLSE